jgi:hypothetical protein
VGALKHSNMIIEIHDFVSSAMLPSVMPSLAASHRLSLVYAGPRNPHAFAFLDHCTDFEKWLLICENRPQAQRWMIAERRAQPPEPESHTVQLVIDHPSVAGSG